jgi:hypothetical protein
MYLEHDINVPWAALLGWAGDMPWLEELGFQRSFYRVETSEMTGLPSLTDQVRSVNISLHKEKLRVILAGSSGQVKVCLRWPGPWLC